MAEKKNRKNFTEAEDQREEKAGASGKSGKKKRGAFFWICLIVLIAAVAGIGVYQMKLKNAQDTYEELAEQVAVDVDDTAEESAADAESGDAEASADAVVIPVDFTALQEENTDIYAWIHIDDTVIDYPILQSEEDDQYYLNRQVDGTEGLPGSIYTHASYNGTDFTDNVTVIYGHNMRNDTMFGSLSEWQSSDYREEHPYIEIYTPEHILTYQIVCCVTFDNRLIPYHFAVDTDEGYAEFLEELSSTRTIPTWISDDFDEITTDDRMIILSTCNGNDSQRFLVGAVLIDEQ